MTDALVSASIKNNLTTPGQLSYWRDRLFKLGTPTDDQIKNNLDNILSNTTIKRACCLGGTDPNNFNVNVRIPLPENYTTGIPEINTKFGYIDKVVSVPSSMCKNLPTATGRADYTKPAKNNPTYNGPCDDFYDVYCANMLAFYNDEYTSTYPNQKPDNKKFVSQYKPECACFSPDATIPQSVNYGPLCFMAQNCNTANNDSGTVYLDYRSRGTCPSSLTICNQIVDLSGAQAGGNIVVSPEMKNECKSNGIDLDNSTVNTGGSQQNTGGGQTGGQTGGQSGSGKQDNTSNTNKDTTSKTTVEEEGNNWLDDLFGGLGSESEEEKEKQKTVVIIVVVVIGLLFLALLMWGMYKSYKVMRSK
ncbi:hypothetical protein YASMINEVIRUS_996 [Yasminevirus sp. GU-2018]|uniref:Uncharacterized protein n=1 Tax=Yasminevirus sp. GU-2018 TaxID=2420051 RepID=A0A5K0UAP3_9VIRU|nr:hypothetical protein YASMINEVIRUS_996 [Yasminevirus sp. GU-2018]